MQMWILSVIMILISFLAGIMIGFVIGAEKNKAKTKGEPDEKSGSRYFGGKVKP